VRGGASPCGGAGIFGGVVRLGWVGARTERVEGKREAERNGAPPRAGGFLHKLN
jgi:hypothetical protein